MSDKSLSKWTGTSDATPETRSPSGHTLPPAASPLHDGQSAATLQPGARPLPDYELVRKLGEGGFGEVWHARGPGGLDVALKFIHLAKGGSHLEERALEVMKTIRHPNLVSLFGAWRHDTRLILAMELCERSLQDRLAEALAQKLPGIPMKELLNYMRDAAGGLDALHEHTVQHRDVKPLNLLLMHKGIKVADFGLAKVLERTAASHSGSMTFAYAAPEFFNGKTTEHSDLYSLAVTYFQLRTGRLVFEGNLQQIMYGHLNQQPDLSALPEAEIAVVARALAKDPEKRWRSCKAFVNELIKAYNKDESKPTKKELDKPINPPAGLRPKSPPDKTKNEPKHSENLSPTEAKLLAQPTILPGSERSGAESAPTRRQRAVAPRKRGFAMVLAGLILSVLVICGGAVGLWSLASSLFRSNPIGGAHDDPPPLAGDRVTSSKTLPSLKLGRISAKGKTFTMGSPEGEKDRYKDETEHQVTLSTDYYLGVTAVTRGQFAEFVKDDGYKTDAEKADEKKTWREPGFEQTDDHPVVYVSHNDALAFCAWLKKKDGRDYMLPTEAQWEFGCRAGSKTAYSFGDDPEKLGDYAWFSSNSGSATHAVATRKPNDWGLYDMHGNVWQWCADVYGDYPIGAVTDPQGLKEGSIRVMRGGCWFNDAGYCRSAYRGSRVPTIRSSYLGFRLAVPVR